MQKCLQIGGALAPELDALEVCPGATLLVSCMSPSYTLPSSFWIIFHPHPHLMQMVLEKCFEWVLRGIDLPKRWPTSMLSVSLWGVRVLVEASAIPHHFCEDVSHVDACFVRLWIDFRIGRSWC